MTPAPIPDELTVTPDYQALIVHWSDGRQSRLSAATLRREARDAETRRAVIDQGPLAPPPGLMITGLDPIGRDAVNIHFSDGHRRGIYPFAYLHSLAARFGN